MSDAEAKEQLAHWNAIRDRAGRLLEARKRKSGERGAFERFSRSVGTVIGSPYFFASLLVVHTLWIVVNLRFWPWDPFDPYPFIFLATIASVEAPFITVLILFNQREAQHLTERREELDILLTLHSEEQLSLLLRLMRETQQGRGTPSHEDRKLADRLAMPLDVNVLSESLGRNRGEQSNES